MIAAAIEAVAADARGDSILLLPHFRAHHDGIQTLGGRIITLGRGERALVARCVGEGEFGTQVLSRAERDAAQVLIAAGCLVQLPPPEARARAPVDVVLSPHIDDAALSLGGSIVLSDRYTLVVNIFTRQSYQTGLRVPPERLDGIARTEDRIVARMLGYRSVDLDLAGAQDRHRLGVAAVMGKSIAEVQDRCGDDVAMITRLSADAIRRAIGTTPIAAVYAPAAIGGHLDHVVVALAAATIAAALNVPAARLMSYEDLPYAAAAMRGGIDLSAYQACSRDVTDAIAAKRAALGVFKTRLRAPQAELCIAHAYAVGGARRAAERCFVRRDERSGERR